MWAYSFRDTTQRRERDKGMMPVFKRKTSRSGWNSSSKKRKHEESEKLNQQGSSVMERLIPWASSQIKKRIPLLRQFVFFFFFYRDGFEVQQTHPTCPGSPIAALRVMMIAFSPSCPSSHLHPPHHGTHYLSLKMCPTPLSPSVSIADEQTSSVSRISKRKGSRVKGMDRKLSKPIEWEPQTTRNTFPLDDETTLVEYIYAVDVLRKVERVNRGA